MTQRSENTTDGQTEKQKTGQYRYSERHSLFSRHVDRQTQLVRQVDRHTD